MSAKKSRHTVLNRRTALRRARSRRGALTLEMLLAMALVFVLMGSLLTYALSLSTNARRLETNSAVQSAATTALNRLSRDVSEAINVQVATPTEVVLDTTNVPGIPAGQIRRTAYKITGSGADTELVTRQDNVAPNTALAPGWVPQRTLVRGVIAAKTKFSYVGSDGTVLPDPVDASQVKLVTLDLQAATDKGRVTLTSSTRVDTPRGTGSAGVPPTADDDTGPTLTRGGAPRSVDVLANDTCSNGTDPCPREDVTLTIMSIPTGVTVTNNGLDGVLTVAAGTSQVGSSLSFEYMIEDSRGSATATVTFQVNNAPQAPDARDDSVNVQVDDTSTGTWEMVHFPVLDNDYCDDGNGTLVIGCPAGTTDPEISVITPQPAGTVIDVSGAGRTVRVWVNEGYAGPNPLPITYRLVDKRNPSLDGNDAGTVPGDDAVLNAWIGPAAVDDNATVQADGATVSTNVLGNDVRHPGTVTWITARPAWVSAAANGNVTMTPDAAVAAGTYTYQYRVTDSRGLTDLASLRVTVTAALPPVAVNAGAWNFADTDSNALADSATNRITLSGGNGSYKLYRATQVDGAGQPTGTVVKVCDSTDAVTTNDCANPVDDNVQLSSGWQYIAYDSRTANPVTAAPTSTRRYSNDYVVTFPQDPRLLGFGSDADNNRVPERQGVNTLHWVKNNAFSEVGIRQRIMTPNWGFVELLDANQTDLGIQQLSSTDCAGMWSSCLRLGGQAPGSERIYQAYALTQVEAAGTDVSNRCDLYPGSPITPRTYGGVGYCPSPAQGQGMGYNMNYNTEVVRGNGNAGGSDTDGNANSRTRDAIRLYQAPSAPADFGIGDRSVDDWVDGYGGVHETCPDVERGNNNRVYGCKSALAYAEFTVNGSLGSDSANGGGYCGLAGDPGNCYGLYNRTTDGWTSAPVEPTAGCGGWCHVPTVSHALGAMAWGNTEHWRGMNCNAGGCSQSPTVPVYSYPSPVTVNIHSINPGKQYWNYWSRTTHPARTNATGGDCWDAPWVARCQESEPASVKVSWSESAGRNHFSVGGVQNLDSTWGYDYGGGACYNFGLTAHWSYEDQGRAHPDASADGIARASWHNNQGAGNPGYKGCNWRIGTGDGRTYANTAVKVWTPTTAAFTIAANPIASNGLRQRSDATVWTSSGRPSMVADGLFCNPNKNVAVGGTWQLGYAIRPTATYADETGIQQDWPDYWERYVWIGLTGTDDGDGQDDAASGFFRGLASANGGNYWPPDWHNDRWITSLQAPSGTAAVGTWRETDTYPGGKVAHVVGDMGGLGSINRSLAFPDNDGMEPIFISGLTTVVSWRSYAPPNAYVGGINRGTGWSYRTSHGTGYSGAYSRQCKAYGWNWVEANSFGSPKPNYFTPVDGSNDVGYVTWKASPNETGGWFNRSRTPSLWPSGNNASNWLWQNLS